jgi:hypothetical protein
LQESGVTLALVEIDVLWEGHLRTSTVQVSYFDWDRQSDQITDTGRLQRIRATALEQELTKVSLRRTIQVLPAIASQEKLQRAVGKLYFKFKDTWCAPLPWPSAKLEDPDRTPLMRAAASGDAGLVERLLGEGVPVNASDQRGETALLQALTWPNRKEVVQMLVAAGAHVNARNLEGETALMRATWLADTQAVKVLLSQGTTANARNSLGSTALTHAADIPVEAADVETIRLLLATGAQVDAKRSDGRTALFLAARRANVPAVKELIAAGADVNARDVEGVSVLQAVEQAKGRTADHDTISRLLRNAGAKP